MASLLIRKLDDALHVQLKARAHAHRRSLEEEVRETLRAAIARDTGVPAESLLAVVTRLFGPEHGIDLDLPRRGGEAQRASPDFASSYFASPHKR